MQYSSKFYGKQLKPLSMFGAFLGTIVGLIFGLTMKMLTEPMDSIIILLIP